MACFIGVGQGKVELFILPILFIFLLRAKPWIPLLKCLIGSCPMELPLVPSVFWDRGPQPMGRSHMSGWPVRMCVRSLSLALAELRVPR